MSNGCRICLEAGHCEEPAQGYKPDSGAVGPTGLWEARVATVIVRSAVTRLLAMGYTAFAKRQKGQQNTLTELVARVNAAQPAIFVALHLNAAWNRSAQGAQVYRLKGSSPAALTGQALGESILARLPNNNTRWSRVIPANYYVLREVAAPSRVLVEADFISNAAVEVKLKDLHQLEQIAEGLAAGIDEYARRLVP